MDAAAAELFAPEHPLSVQRVHLGSDFVDYEAAWHLQREVHAAVADGTMPATLLVLEHADVFTAGKRTEPGDLPVDGSRVIEVDRGGRITWHGPGQLVVYPIVPLPHPLDVVAHVRRLESAIIATCADYGIATQRVDGRSGVWCSSDKERPERKIAAIGVRVARGVTMHGLALNVDCDLTWGTRIVPCGIPDAGVTSMAAELPSSVDLDIIDVAEHLEHHLREVLEPTLPQDTA